ncbi:MAG: hypothetical protein LBH00_05500 [Planctomycetaceae bacterium]|jgi:hypothetical protein|nr:hypothetical protein [Planctomycetaceae bacterium]
MAALETPGLFLATPVVFAACRGDIYLMLTLGVLPYFFGWRKNVASQPLIPIFVLLGLFTCTD